MDSQARANRLRVGALLAGSTVLAMTTAGLVAGRGGLVLAALVTGGIGAVSLLNGDRITLRAMAARPVGEVEHPRLHRLVHELCRQARQPVPRLYVSPTPAPNAFATGRGPRQASLCVTAGLLTLLDEPELRAVLAHELAHVAARDTLVSSVATGVASALTGLAGLAVLLVGEDEEGPGPVGVLALLVLAPLAAVALHLSLSRSAEVRADAAAARATGEPRVLASALRRIEEGTRSMPLQADRVLLTVGHQMIACPYRRRRLARLFATHPPMAERLARLEEMAGPPRRRPRG